MVIFLGKVVGCACTVAAPLRIELSALVRTRPGMQQQGLTCGIDQGSGLSFQLGIVKLALHPG